MTQKLARADTKCTLLGIKSQLVHFENVEDQPGVTDVGTLSCF